MLSKGIGTIAARSLSMEDIRSRKPRWVFTPFSFSSSPSKARKLALYSKPGCSLCDGLKEKLHAAFSLSGSDTLHDVVLQVRDITSNLEWEKAYQYEIPVLAKELSDGTETNLHPMIFAPSLQLNQGIRSSLIRFDLQQQWLEEILPRLSPRIGVELVQKKIAAAFRQANFLAPKGKENEEDCTIDEEFQPPEAVVGD